MGAIFSQNADLSSQLQFKAFFKAKNNFFEHKVYESQEIAMNLIFAPVQRRLQDQSFFRGTGSL